MKLLISEDKKTIKIACENEAELNIWWQMFIVGFKTDKFLGAGYDEADQPSPEDAYIQFNLHKSLDEAVKEAQIYEIERMHGEA